MELLTGIFMGLSLAGLIAWAGRVMREAGVLK